MYLKQTSIERFRSCESTTIDFDPALTVLVGENNSGKSNIVDALRLVLHPLSGRRDRYCEDTDLRRGAEPATFCIQATFTALSTTMKGMLLAAMPDVTQDDAVFGLEYTTRSKKYPRGKTFRWAGKFSDGEADRAALEHVRCVYLPALRDAVDLLGSSKPYPMLSLLREYLGSVEEPEFLKTVARQATNIEMLGKIGDDVSARLGELTDGVRKQTASVGFAEDSLMAVARDLRFKLHDHGVDLEDIQASGLGYANLLYMAVTVLELSKASEADLTVLIVEEPEAHLHPHLQALVLEFLLQQANKSATAPVVSNRPEGRIQVVVTTHSPNLTAWIDPKHVVVVRSLQKPTTAPATVCVPVAQLKVDATKLRKVSRYLDVTRSALLFSSRALLLEGIAEQLLIPVIARHCVLKDRVEAWRRFKGATLVAVEGVDFEPYLELLLTAHNGIRIADKLIVVTDGDPSAPGDRKNKLEALASVRGAGQHLQIFTNEVTLEHELVRADNLTLLGQVFLQLHSKSAKDWAAIEGLPTSERPQAVVELFRSKGTKKGDFAQRLAQKIEEGAQFFVPQYLIDAIEALVSSDD